MRRDVSPERRSRSSHSPSARIRRPTTLFHSLRVSSATCSDRRVGELEREHALLHHRRLAIDEVVHAGREMVVDVAAEPEEPLRSGPSAARTRRRAARRRPPSSSAATPRRTSSSSSTRGRTSVLMPVTSSSNEAPGGSAERGQHPRSAARVEIAGIADPARDNFRGERQIDGRRRRSDGRIAQPSDVLAMDARQHADAAVRGRLVAQPVFGVGDANVGGLQHFLDGAEDEALLQKQPGERPQDELDGRKQLGVGRDRGRNGGRARGIFFHNGSGCQGKQGGLWIIPRLFCVFDRRLSEKGRLTPVVIFRVVPHNRSCRPENLAGRTLECRPPFPRAPGPPRGLAAHDLSHFNAGTAAHRRPAIVDRAL